MTREEAIEMLKKDKEQRGNCFISDALDMAIKALETESCEDAISRQAVKDFYYKNGYIDFRKICELPPVTPHYTDAEIQKMQELEQAEIQKAYKLGKKEQPNKWIPVKWHNITDEERQREDYPKEWLTMLDCPMPNDEEEILVTVKSSKGGLHVENDVCYVDDGFSLDSGYDWIDDVTAWMPLPQPYKESEE